MTIEEKLKHFTTVTVESVQEECDKTLNEYKAGLDKNFETYKEDALKEASLKEQTLRDVIQRKASKEYTLEQLHIKRKINHMQKQLCDMLFEEVEKKLELYKKTPEYKELLVKQIKEAVGVARGEELKVFLDSEDKALKDELENICKIKLYISENPFKGGTRCEISKKNILIDNTFETRIEEIKENYVITL